LAPGTSQPFRVLHGHLEGAVHADRPADRGAALDAGVVEHGDCILDERVDANPGHVTRSVRPADTSVVPGHDVHAAVGFEQRGPRMWIGPEPVAKQDGRPVSVVRPGLQLGAVSAAHVVVAQRFLRRAGDGGEVAGSRHSHESAGTSGAGRTGCRIERDQSSI
jgi:hypothetical protein